MAGWRTTKKVWPAPISVAPEVWSCLPGFHLVVITAEGFDNQAARPILVEALAERQAILASGWEHGSAQAHPHLALWREVMRAIGVKPSQKPASIEALVKRALGDQPVTSINPLVDLHHIVSLRYLVTAGGWDLDRLDGKPTLGFTTGSERFVDLGTEAREPVEAGELAYACGRDVITRHFVWRQSDLGKITATTTRALLVVEIPAARAPNLAMRVRETLIALLATHFGIAAQSWILHE